ncbi:hypothetical protein [Paraburkholderia susongensis]|nr:hypothetical protein [Paraburkholderia susongensis]
MQLIDEAGGESYDEAQHSSYEMAPQRNIGVPQQQSGHAGASAANTQAARAGAVRNAAARDTPERPSKGKGKSV